MVCEIWRETGRIKAGKNFKVTEPKFSNVTALNGLAKFYCIMVSADRTLQIYATICIFQIRNLSYIDVTHITHVTFVRNTESLEIGNMSRKALNFDRPPLIQSLHLEDPHISFTNRE